jgi:VWFA-related protein
MGFRFCRRIGLGSGLFLCLTALVAGQPGAAQTSTLAQVGTAQAAAAPTPPATAAPSAAGSRISLDVLVTGNAGKPVAEMEPPDFTLLDNSQPRKILSFRRTDGTVGSRTDPPVEVIIVLDAVNLPYQAVTAQRLDIERFLRQNNGHLAQPVSIFVFSSQGLHVQPAPSKDGNALAATLDQSTGAMRSRGTAAGVYGLAEQFQSSIQNISGIAENEARKPGRKVLIWIGPGWPLLNDRHFIETNESKQTYFHSIVSLSKKLREARMTVYSIYAIVGVASRGLYEAYLKPVQDPRKTETGNLALQVLVNQTGGRVIDSSNDLPGQIASCIADIGPYYTLTFAPPPAARADEYHDLKVQVAQPGLTVRTNSGYYNQP